MILTELIKKATPEEKEKIKIIDKTVMQFVKKGKTAEALKYLNSIKKNELNKRRQSELAQ